MLIVVPVKQVPDLVEELEIAADGVSLDQDAVKYVLNEFDDHALEEALQIKEARSDVEVVALTLDLADADQVLFTCLAKGADRAVKVTGDFPDAPDSHTTARAMASVIAGMSPALICTGVQAVDDLDGQVGPLLATYLKMPHVSVATRIEVAEDGRTLTTRQEYSGGMMAEFEVDLPAVIGVQAARETPRYASISRVRQLMKTAQLEEAAAGGLDGGGSGLEVQKLSRPETTSHAEMLDGGPDEVAEAITRMIQERGLVRA